MGTLSPPTSRLSIRIEPGLNCDEDARARRPALSVATGLDAVVLLKVPQACGARAKSAEPVTVPGRQRTAARCAAPGIRGSMLRCARETNNVTFPGRGAARSGAPLIRGLPKRGACQVRGACDDPGSAAHRCASAACCAAPGNTRNRDVTAVLTLVTGCVT